jgi:HEAT repeat protein
MYHRSTLRVFSLLVMALTASGCTPEPLYHGKPLAYWKQELTSKETVARYRAAAVFRDLGPKAKVALPELIACLHDDELRIIFLSAAALGNIGPDAKDAVPHLLELLKDDRPRIRETVEEALKEINAE